MENSPRLSVKDLTVQFVTKTGCFTAVDQLSFDINAGQTMGLVGESGSGKSVTALALMGLVPSSSGTIKGQQVMFQGRNLLGLSEKQMRLLRGNRISMIFQEPMTALNPVFRVGTQVAEVLRLHKKMPKRLAWQRTIELFDSVGITEPEQKVRSYPHQLSGGQQQRVMIAMAIACEPDLLICDEPTTALDVTIQKQVLILLKRLQQEMGMSMLFISHDLGVVAEVADHVLVMYRSQLVEQGSVEKIFTRAEHPYTQGLLACRPQLGNNPKRLLTVTDFVDTANEKALSVNKERLKPQVKEDKSDLPTLLRVDHLTTMFPIKGGLLGRTVDHFKAVDGVSFDVKCGETLGLVGESGSGKTTLGRTILRLQQASSGHVFYDGIDLFAQNKNEMRAMRSRMQIIFQDPYAALNPRMRVDQALIEPLVLHGLKKSQNQQQAQAVHLLEQVGLSSDALYRYPHEFSGGQRQRICIARALAVEPEFIVCDESVSALDVSVQAQVLNLLKDLQDELSLTYIFISHDLSVVQFMADRVAVMKQGQLVELNSAENIFNNPKHPYTKGLINAIPKPPDYGECLQ